MKAGKRTSPAIRMTIWAGIAVFASVFFAVSCDVPDLYTIPDVPDNSPNPTRWTITFNSNGGSSVPNQSVRDGGKISKPANPDKQHYDFDGWYEDDKVFEYPWDFANYIVDENIILFAKWILLPGTGTVDDPFLLNSVEQLQMIGTGGYIYYGDFESEIEPVFDPVYEGWTLDAHYMLWDDITLIGYWDPIAPGNGDEFQGSFDGNGKTITGLHVEGNYAQAAMFGDIGDGGVVKNLTLKECKIFNNGYSAGSVAGMNRGQILNCSVSGEISAGGLAGGIVANNIGVIENCFVTADVKGDDYVGGIAGQNSGTVRNCVVLNTNIMVIGNNYGRVVGDGAGSMSHNYGQVDMQKNGNPPNPPWGDDSENKDGASIDDSNYDSADWWTDADNWDVDTGSKWDFDEIWEWDGTKLRPVLRGVEE